MKNKTKSQFKISNVLIAFILCVSLVALVGTLVLKNTVFSASYVNGVLKEQQDYTKIAEDALQQGLQYYQSANIDVPELAAIFTADEIAKDQQTYIENAYAGTATKIDKASEFEKIEQGIYEKFEQENIEINEEMREEMVWLTGAVSAVYENTVTLDQLLVFTNSNVTVIIIAAGAILLLAILLLFVLGRKASALPFLSTGILGAGITLLTVPYFLQLTNVYEFLLGEDDTQNALVVAVMSSATRTLLLSGAAMLLVGILLSVGYVLKTKRKSSQNA